MDMNMDMNKHLSFNLLELKLKIDLSPFPHELPGYGKNWSVTTGLLQSHLSDILDCMDFLMKKSYLRLKLKCKLNELYYDDQDYPLILF